MSTASVPPLLSPLPNRWTMQIALLTVILFLTYWWGNYPSDHAYQLLQTARHFQSTTPHPQTVYVAWLAIFNNPTVAIFTTAIGWWVAVCAFWQLLLPTANLVNVPLRANKVITLLTVCLFAIHPAQFSVMGSGFSWVLGIALWLLAVQNKPKDLLTALLVIALFAVWFDWTSGAYVLLIVGWQYFAKRTILPFTTIVALIGAGLAVWLVGFDMHFGAIVREIMPTFSQYFYESDLYWLVAPFLLLGLWGARWQPRLLIWLLWVTILLSRSAPLGMMAGGIAGIFLLHTTFTHLTHWLTTQKQVTIHPNLPLIGILFVGICTEIAFGMSTRFRHQLRPIALYSAENQAIAYLSSNNISPTSFAGSARLAYLLDTPATIWQNDTPTDIMAIVVNPPDLLIMPVSHWAREMRQTVWLQQRYQPLQQIVDGTTGLTLLQKTTLPTDSVLTTPHQITTPFGLNLTSVQIAPHTITGGDTVEVLLNWQATSVITPFGTVLNLTNPLDGTPYAQIDVLTPNNLSAGWLEEGQIVPNYYRFTTVPDMPVGAYPVTMILHEPDSLDPQPLFRAGEANQLDRDVLGYVAVPWQGDIQGEPINATFGENILLHAAEITGDVVANGTIHVTLYWGVTATPIENYTIYLHFLDADGNYITGTDVVPFGGRYPTRGWHVGDVIPSEHELLLPDGVGNAGISPYQIKTGLYLPSTGTRLPATNADGTQPPDNSILLKEIRD